MIATEVRLALGMQTVILVASVFSAGAVVQVAWVNLKAWRHGARFAGRFALARFGMAGIVLQLGRLVLLAGYVPFNADTIFYSVCLIAITYGNFGILQQQVLAYEQEHVLDERPARGD